MVSKWWSAQFLLPPTITCTAAHAHIWTRRCTRATPLIALNENKCMCLWLWRTKKTMQLQRASETCQQTSANPLPTMQPQCLLLVQRKVGVKCLSSAVFCFSRFFTCRTRAPSKKISVKSAGTMWWLSHLHSFFQRYFHFQISICKMRWKDRALSMQMDPSSTHWDLIIC